VNNFSNNLIDNMILGLFALGLCIVVAPFIVLTGFSHPAVDDFCFAVSFRDVGVFDYFGVVYDWYVGFTGLYSYLMAIGVFTANFNLIESYKYVSLLVFVGWIITCFIFFKSIFIEVRSSVIAISTLAMLTLYLLTMPEVSDFYWMTSALQYQLGNIVAMLVFACLIRIVTGKYQKFHIVGSGILLIIVIGMTELYMVFMVLSILSITIYYYFIGTRDRHVWVCLLTIVVVAAAVVGLAPGNEERGQHFVARHQLWFSIAASAYHTIMWTLQWLWEPLLWLLTILYVIWLPSILSRSQLQITVKLKHIVIFLAIGFGYLFACYFVGYWAMGDILPPRALNVVYFVFINGWFLSIAGGVIVLQNSRFSQWLPQSSWNVKRVASGVIVILTITVMLTNSSFRTAYADLFNRAEIYDNKFKMRYTTILNTQTDNPNQIVKVAKIDRTEQPNTIFFRDLGSNKNEFPNPCYAEYFGIGAVEATGD
jgi:hypothetical protein